MVILRLPNSPRMALYANAVANLVDGEFRQRHDTTSIEIVLDGPATVRRADLLPVSGRNPEPEVWAALCSSPIQGHLVDADSEVVRFEG